jgi:hypothetical protein
MRIDCQNQNKGAKGIRNKGWFEPELLKKSPVVAEENTRCILEMYRTGKWGFHRLRCSGSSSTSCC